jgi:chromosome partitioning protein
LRSEAHPTLPAYTCVKLTGGAVRTEVMRLAERFDEVVIDTGGRDTSSQRAALSVADVLLVPFVPRSFDLWSLEKAAALVEEMRTVNPSLRAYCFLNRADPRGSDNSDAADILRETDTLAFLDTPLGSRKAFSNAAAHGVAVTELKPRDPKAIEELGALYRAVFEMPMRSG